MLCQLIQTSGPIICLCSKLQSVYLQRGTLQLTKQACEGIAHGLFMLWGHRYQLSHHHLTLLTNQLHKSAVTHACHWFSSWKWLLSGVSHLSLSWMRRISSQWLLHSLMEWWGVVLSVCLCEYPSWDHKNPYVLRNFQKFANNCNSIQKKTTDFL